jgi:hypothetical protein
MWLLSGVGPAGPDAILTKSATLMQHLFTIGMAGTTA